jgi:hypothetical protein
MNATQIFSDPAMDREFQRNGFVVTPFLDRREIEVLRKLYYDTLPEVIPDFYSTIFDKDIERQKRVSDKIESLVARKVEDLIPNYKKFLNNFIAKPPTTTQGRLGLHQDYTLVDQSVHTGVHLWCPLVDVDERNGCLKVVAGSHSFVNHISAAPAPMRPGSSRPPERVRLGTNPSPYDLVRDTLESECIRRVPMNAGQAFFFNERLLHASDDNRSQDSRIAVAGAYIPRGIQPRLYLWDHEKPTQLKVIELRDAFVVQFGFDLPVVHPFPEGVTSVGSVEYVCEPLTVEQIEPLRIVKAATANASGGAAIPPSELAAAGASKSRGWLSRLLSR